MTTNFDCVLCCNNQNYTMIKNTSHITLEAENGEELFLLLYPNADKHYISYAAELKMENHKVITKCPYVEMVEDSEGNFELEFKPQELFHFAIQKIYKSTLGGYDLKIIEAPKNLVCFDDGSEVFLQEFEGNINSYKFVLLSSNPAILINQKQQQKLFILKHNKVEEFTGQIELREDDTFSVISEQHDYAKHAIKTEYKFENGELVTISSDLFYDGNGPQIAVNPNIIPLAFFEAVKAKNISLAKEYLSPRLKKGVSLEMLEEYFGSFEKVKPYNFQVEKGHFVSVTQKNKSKIFRIKMNDGKIDEIELL